MEGAKDERGKGGEKKGRGAHSSAIQGPYLRIAQGRCAVGVAPNGVAPVLRSKRLIAAGRSWAGNCQRHTVD